MSKKRSLPKHGAPLSFREEDVARFIAKGYTTQEVANEMGIAFDTVKMHLTRIRIKLGVQRSTQIAAWAAQHLLENEL